MRKYLFYILLTVSAVVSAVAVFDCDRRTEVSCANSIEAGIFDDYSDYVSEIISVGLSADNTFRQEPTAGSGSVGQSQLHKNYTNKFLLDGRASASYKSLFLKRLDIKNSLFGGCRFLYLIRVLRN